MTQTIKNFLKNLVNNDVVDVYQNVALTPDKKNLVLCAQFSNLPKHIVVNTVYGILENKLDFCGEIENYNEVKNYQSVVENWLDHYSNYILQRNFEDIKENKKV